MFAEGTEMGMKPVLPRMLVRYAIAHHGGLRLRALHGDVRFQPAYQSQSVAPAVCFGGKRESSEQIDVSARGEHRSEIERRRQHPYHRSCVIVQSNCLTDNAWIGAKASLPEAVGQHHRSGSVPLALVGAEIAAKRWLDAEQLKEIPRDGHRAQSLRVSGSSEAAVAHAIESEIAGDIGERCVSTAIIQQPADLHGLAGEVALIFRLVRDPDQTLRIAERQRANQQCIQDAEYGGTCADAECDNQQRERGKSRVAPQGAHGVAEILTSVAHPARDPCAAGVFGLQGDVAEFSTSGGTGLGFRHPLRNQFLSHCVDVKLHLFRHQAVPLALMQPVAQSALQTSENSLHAGSFE